MRLSSDRKAKVKIGNLSRSGKARTLEARQADDHDDHWEAVLVPFGILDVASNQLAIYFGQSAETSDFIVDCLTLWWQAHRCEYPDIQELAIDLDSGSAVRSKRPQFIKRMVQFSQTTGLRVRLIYYSPYHSKYNPIVGFAFPKDTLLGSVGELLEWARLRWPWDGLPI